jgi:hypothetical protein
MKRAFRTLLAVLPWLLATAAPLRAQGICLGSNQEPHPYGSFTFKTNSGLGAPPLKGYKYGIVSCVTHDDPVNPLYVKWVIPGPHGWVPAKQSLDSLARATNVVKFDQLKGCLLFGNQGETTQGTFIGIEGDERRVADENKTGCRAAVAAIAQPTSGGIQGILQKIRNWFPSDASQPRVTLLQFDGEVGVRPQGDGYVSFVSYTFSRYSDSQGSVEQLTARPVFRDATEALLPAFNRSNTSPIKFATKGSIEFTVPSMPNPWLSYASYEVRDREQRVVGEISIPLFVSGRPLP